MIKEQIEKDLKSAMLSGDKELVSILRGIKSVILYAEVETGKRDSGLGEEVITKLMQKEAKKRAEAYELYKKAGESERAAKETHEQEVIKKYLPEQLSEPQIDKMIKEVINGLGQAPNTADMGKIIGAVKVKTGGSADGAVIAKLTQKRLRQNETKE